VSQTVAYVPNRLVLNDENPQTVQGLTKLATTSRRNDLETHRLRVGSTHGPHPDGGNLAGRVSLSDFRW
jgi:hypothetical protein